MPRIDPLQLLKCLSVLLSPEGGILSKEEVPRLVNLMTKFSKKLVSKCVYLLILRNTEQQLVDMFMSSGGWSLVQTWLQEAMVVSNWDLVVEILELLLTTPVDSARLRLNNIPKLVKSLSKRDELGGVKQMADQLVNNWLAIVKSNVSTPDVEKIQKEVAVVVAEEQHPVSNNIETVVVQELPVNKETVANAEDEDSEAISTGTFYKLTVRDGKQVISRLSNASEEGESEEKVAKEETVETENKDEVKENKVDNKKEDKKDELKEKRRSSSSSKSNSSRSSSSRDKDKHRSSSKSSPSSRSSSSSTRDKDRDRDRKDRDRHKSNDSKRSSSSSSSKKSSSSSSRDKDRRDSKETKEKQAEKDKDTLAKIKPQSLDKIGRIPKKSSSDEKDKETKKKPTMSIEVRKNAEERPKTVKVFNAKMRSTGLEEEVKPPPPRPVKKAPTAPIPALPVKRASPPKDTPLAPAEKKMKIEIPERVGAIKLIPPKPKPALQESDIFMDALTAATSKKEPKKRKRRPSVTKESPEASPVVQQSPTTVTSPIGLKNISPANFYQDTMETTEETPKEETPTEEEKVEDRLADTKAEEASPVRSATPTDNQNAEEEESSEPKRIKSDDGLKGVLVYVKKKGPKRSIKWKNDDDLVDIRYFELDENERENVSRKTFYDMAKMEMSNEREALMGSRKLINEDLMEPLVLWRVPYIVDQPELPVQSGSKSLEHKIQFAREKNILQALYFNKSMIPDSPGEPIPESHPMHDPITIPLEDPESQEYDLRNTPWPEPKVDPVTNMPNMFPNIPGAPTFNSFAQSLPGFQGMPPGFVPPNLLPNANNMMNGNLMGGPNMGPPIDMMNQPPMNPNIFGPGPGPDAFPPMMNDNNYPMPFNQPNMNMFGPGGGPPHQNNFNNRGHNNRNNFRHHQGHQGNNNNNGHWQRISGGPSRDVGNWKRGGGVMNRGRSRLCNNIKNKGFCRNIDNCPYIHPN